METVVQWVCTSWTKRSRGGLAASHRNKAPMAFPLPPVAPPFVHSVLMYEADGFRPHFETHEGPPDSGSDTGVLLHEADGLLRVQLTVTPFGMPRRWRRPPAVRLARGEWLRWQVNYRFAGTCSGDWTYRLDTLNIANGPAPTDLFLGAPTTHVDERAALR
ncbi:hypothetical protein HYE82_10305 [Streptomyces sp. BR123]|uniref:hypothetical protein n=1 Tax=Streptomyces sp. BR123 TaxID=2749828 RepID=UPI0015C4B0E5|nr:hypothetical protein [Streptomyces sp. BR123]NXY94777.1 hypothetical protein [Streptomyces sp. BR123]